MTTPNEQMARELLAAEWEADGQVMLSGMIRIGHSAAVNNEHTQRALRAISRALSHAAAVEGGLVGNPVAWMDPETRDVVNAERKAEWATHFGAPGRIKSAAYTIPLLPPAPAAVPVPPNHLLFPVNVMGGPMREYAPGKWENATWPSDAPAAVAGGEVVEAMARTLYTAHAAQYVGTSLTLEGWDYLEEHARKNWTVIAAAALAAQPAAVDAVPNDDRDMATAVRHNLYVYEVDFGDEGTGRYVRLADFNKVVAKLEAKQAVTTEGEKFIAIEPLSREVMERLES